MTTNKRRYTRTRSALIPERTPWGDWAIEFMEFGPFKVGGLKDIDDGKAYWEAYGEAFTEEYIAEYPGHRPAPWWHFTHGKSRPIANPLPPEVEERLMRENTHAGVLHSEILHGRCNGVEVLHTAGACHDERCVMVPWQEDQTAYLDRMGLLTDAERLALGRPASPPRPPRQPRR